MNSQPDIAVFLVAVDSENKIIQILHGNGQKIKLDRIVNIRTGTYLETSPLPLRLIYSYLIYYFMPYFVLKLIRLTKNLF